ncbi:MAG: Lrp/AsnC family transcriptional regulator [Pseudomonadales bacterium]|nr:Lrp/AsnC family transcriptional regulator [Pseudomonadales bacterium]NRA18474.1 Lrp/AsnC family transcriptional regulator [Oceanospirillaceae bacterium]
MDNIDKKIIRELQLNARISNEELAEKVNLSASPCLRRVRKLESSGILIGYTAVVDQVLCGLGMNVFLSVRLEKPDKEIMKNFEQAVSELDEVLECYLMTGSRDYLLKVVSNDLKSYEAFIRDKFSNLPGISSIESSFAFGHVKQQQFMPI